MLNRYIGRFGNKLLYYNTLRQIADYLNTEWYCDPFQGSEYFIDLIKPSPVSHNEYLNSPDKNKRTNFEKYNVTYLLPQTLLPISKEQFKEATTKYLKSTMVLTPCDYHLFFKFDNLSTFDIFRFKEPFISNQKHIGIHIRSNEFYRFYTKRFNLKYPSLEFDYYKKAIEKTQDKNARCCVFTDNPNSEVYQSVLNLLAQMNLTVEVGDSSSYINDFKRLANCHTVISTLSTFCLAASIMGRENKTIIQSKEFIEGNAEKWPLCKSMLTEYNRNYKISEMI